MMWHADAPGRQQDLRCGRVGIAFRFSDVMQLELCSPLVFEHVIVMLQNFKLDKCELLHGSVRKSFRMLTMTSLKEAVIAQ